MSYISSPRKPSARERAGSPKVEESPWRPTRRGEVRVPCLIVVVLPQRRPEARLIKRRSPAPPETSGVDAGLSRKRTRQANVRPLGRGERTREEECSPPAAAGKLRHGGRRAGRKDAQKEQKVHSMVWRSIHSDHTTLAPLVPLQIPDERVPAANQFEPCGLDAFSGFDLLTC
jgi:hypothetical protein